MVSEKDKYGLTVVNEGVRIRGGSQWYSRRSEGVKGLKSGLLGPRAGVVYNNKKDFYWYFFIKFYRNKNKG